MSLEYTRLCCTLLEQCFGKVVQAVGKCMFSAVARTLTQIVDATNYPRKEVMQALAVLIKFQLVTFVPCKSNPYVPEYMLKREDVICLLRYSRYVHLVQSKYDDIGASITEQLMNYGSDTATTVILKCLAENEGKAASAQSYKETFLQMISDHFLIKMPQLLPPADDQDEAVPKFQTNECDYFIHPNIDVQLLEKIRKNEAKAEDAADCNIIWHLNYDRFHQEFRDELMKLAIERKLGPDASECFHYVLQIMYRTTDPWQRTLSNHVTYAEIKQTIERSSNNLYLMKYLDQFLAWITEDSLGFMRRIGDMGGGQYVVDMDTAFQSLAYACMESVITERFGTKAVRISRVVRFKKFIEQEDLQKEAMIPAKEAKSIAYSLFQEKFLHVKSVKKTGGGGSGPAKIFYLYQLNQKDAVNMLLDVCFKAFYNILTRSNHEKQEHKGLIEKSQRLDGILEAMKQRGESDEYIAEIVETFSPPECEILNKVKSRLKMLSKAELTMDDTIFLLQMYLHHCTTQPTGIQKFK